MQETKIIVDNRERNITIAEGLAANGVNVKVAQLPVGDYIISDRMCVERKTTFDFENSIMDARLFDQADRLQKRFEKALIIIEGNPSEFTLGKNIITGTILKLYTHFNLQVLFSSDSEDTAYILSRLAEKEQIVDKKEPRLLGHKKAFTIYQWQTLILSSIPGVGPTLANKLIKHFKTLKNVVTATPEDLMEVEKIGKKKAEKIYEILNTEFREMGTD